MHPLKAAIYIPPVVALVIVGSWISSQRQTISVLEEETVVLKQRMAMAEGGSSMESKASRPGKADKPSKDNKPINWKDLASKLDQMQGEGGIRDMREMLRLQQQVSAMSRDDLVRSLDEISALELPPEARQRLEAMILGPLVEKDPEFALTRYVDQTGNTGGGMQWQMNSGLASWAKKDLAASTAWLDRQVAAGKLDSKSLDGKNPTRMQFEGTLIAAILSSNPDAAAARLASLPENQRSEVLGNSIGSSIKDEDQAAYAELVRDQLPEKDQAGALARIATQLAWKDGYDDVNAYLDRINATPAERAAVVGQAADSKIQKLSHSGVITAGNIAEMRQWAQQESPAIAENVTGKALARATEVNRKMEFSEAAALAGKYHQTSGDDQVLVGFLDSGAAWHHKEEARALAETISDEKIREQFLKRFK